MMKQMIANNKVNRKKQHMIDLDYTYMYLMGM